MNGAVNGPTNGPPPPNMPPSPPHSNARSSNGSRLYSMSSTPSSSRKYSMQVMESELHEHHRVLRAFLDQSLREDRGYHPHNRARDKLLRLSPIQFQELSTDVYDELLRREDERAAQSSGNIAKPVPRALIPKQNFHPKRNQARQKLSTLASRKFRELATDVLFELERRVPKIYAPPLERIATTSPTGSNASFSQQGPGRGKPNGMKVQVPPPFYESRRPSGSSPNGPYSPAIFEGDPSTPAQSDYGRPMAKQFQSNTMVPNKSTMVEDDDDGSDGASAYDIDARMSRTSKRTTGASGIGRLRDSHFETEQQTQISQLQQKVSELEEQLKQKDQDLSAAHTEKSEALEAEQSKSTQALADLERQIYSAEELNTNLKQELDRLKESNTNLENRLQDHATTTNDLENSARDHESLRDDHQALQEEHDTIQGVHRTLQEQHGALQQDHGALREELEQLRGEHATLSEQQRSNDASTQWQTRYEELEKRYQDREQAIQQVRQESGQTMQELSTISTQHDHDEDEKEHLLTRVQTLQTEVTEWKARYAKTKTSLRSLKATSMSLTVDQPSAADTVQDAGFTSPTGLIKDVHITTYQTAITELLHLARSPDHTAPFNHMRALVSAVSAVVKDVDAASAGVEEPVAKEHAKLKKQVSRATNNLITTSKTFAASNGLSPLSLVDAAASDLTTAVVGLVRVVKITETKAEELVDGDEEVEAGAGSGKGAP